MFSRCYGATVPRPAEHGAASRPLGAAEAQELAESMRAFGTSSRLLLLFAMLERERTVEELVRATDVAPSAASHQLRLLRQNGLVSVRRTGRYAYYRLHDHHVADLLAAIRHHHEHTRAETESAGVPVRSAHAARAR